MARGSGTRNYDDFLVGLDLLGVVSMPTIVDELSTSTSPAGAAGTKSEGKRTENAGARSREGAARRYRRKK